MPIALEYPVTRSFRWRWFAPLSIMGAGIIFGFLIVINIPLTGYETVTVFQDDFNVTQTHWFDRLMPFRKPKPGSLCDPHVLNGGDPFRTDYSFFEWTVDTITLANAGSSGIRYDGTPLTFCDVTSVYLSADLYTWRADFTVISTCKEEGSFEFTAKTSISEGYLPGVPSPIVGKPGRVDNRGRILDFVFVDLILSSASNGLTDHIRMSEAVGDLANRAFAALLASNHTTPIALSVGAQIPFCPMSLGPQAPCSSQVPQVLITDTTTVYSNSTVYVYSDGSPFRQWLLDDNFYLPLLNIFQAVYAAVRIDWGNKSPNNFILNQDITNATLATTFPVTQWINHDWSVSDLAYRWDQPDPMGLGPGVSYLPFIIDGPANVQLVYLCRFQKLKSSGSLVVSVLVATLSMFSTGWAIFMIAPAAIARQKDPTANRCDGHCSRHRIVPEPSWFDTFNPYAYPPEEPRRTNNIEYQPLAYMENAASPSSFDSWQRENHMGDNSASRIPGGRP